MLNKTKKIWLILVILIIMILILFNFFGGGDGLAY